MSQLRVAGRIGERCSSPTFSPNLAAGRHASGDLAVSPVAHLNGVQGVAGSNPAVPIGVRSPAAVLQTFFSLQSTRSLVILRVRHSASEGPAFLHLRAAAQSRSFASVPVS